MILWDGQAIHDAATTYLRTPQRETVQADETWLIGRPSSIRSTSRLRPSGVRGAFAWDRSGVVKKTVALLPVQW